MLEYNAVGYLAISFPVGMGMEDADMVVAGYNCLGILLLLLHYHISSFFTDSTLIIEQPTFTSLISTYVLVLLIHGIY